MKTHSCISNSSSESFATGIFIFPVFFPAFRSSFVGVAEVGRTSKRYAISSRFRQHWPSLIRSISYKMKSRWLRAVCSFRIALWFACPYHTNGNRIDTHSGAYRRASASPLPRKWGNRRDLARWEPPQQMQELANIQVDLLQ